ncbi:hypothetical protein A6X21_07430 [Planctopirus hydrillae]|uniref:Uncharacterized protein n=1 Tax=Planctopirus hydrillae TaxID=1841610 RepID=A0A1C3E903_9PLAN|nr:hypothetical protein A6X21_07430 [Planctopirus hydrillae]
MGWDSSAPRELLGWDSIPKFEVLGEKKVTSKKSIVKPVGKPGAFLGSAGCIDLDMSTACHTPDLTGDNEQKITFLDTEN